MEGGSGEPMEPNEPPPPLDDNYVFGEDEEAPERTGRSGVPGGPMEPKEPPPPLDENYVFSEDEEAP